MTKRLPSFKEAMVLLDAEDCGIKSLAAYPVRVAATAAIKLTKQLEAFWEVERRELIRRNDGRYAFDLSPAERQWIYSVAVQYCRDPSWDGCPTAELEAELTGLSLDAVLHVALRVAGYYCHQDKIYS